MTEEEYIKCYLFEMYELMHSTLKLVDLYETVKSTEIGQFLLELVAIYYSKPFLSSKRAYSEGDGNGKKGHKILKDEIVFTEEELRVHEIAFGWRNGYIAHSDQSIKNLKITVRRDEDGTPIGFEGSRDSNDIPLSDFHLVTLKSNIHKIISHVLSKTYSK